MRCPMNKLCRVEVEYFPLIFLPRYKTCRREVRVGGGGTNIHSKFVSNIHIDIPLIFILLPQILIFLPQIFIPTSNIIIHTTSQTQYSIFTLHPRQLDICLYINFLRLAIAICRLLSNQIILESL
jgi:hypothetical protein